MRAIAHELIALLERLATLGPLPRVKRLLLPPPGADGTHAGEFCAVELDDGSLGLSFVLLGDTLDALTGARSGHSGERLAGADPLQLARRLDGGTPVERALALAAINAMTDSVIGSTRPSASAVMPPLRTRRRTRTGRPDFRDQRNLPLPHPRRSAHSDRTSHAAELGDGAAAQDRAHRRPLNNRHAQIPNPGNRRRSGHSRLAADDARVRRL